MGAGPDSFSDFLSKILSVRRFPERGARARVARERQRRTLAACDGQAAAGLPPASLFHPPASSIFCSSQRQGSKPGGAKTPTGSLGAAWFTRARRAGVPARAPSNPPNQRDNRPTKNGDAERWFGLKERSSADWRRRAQLRALTPERQTEGLPGHRTRRFQDSLYIGRYRIYGGDALVSLSLPPAAAVTVRAWVRSAACSVRLLHA